MISVEEALAHVLALADPVSTETIPLRGAAGRVLAEPVIAKRDQPPFNASIMDGYAIAGNVQSYTVLREIAAGQPPGPRITFGEAVRIFTGAPVPEGATRVVIQEDALIDGSTLTLAETADAETYIRPKGRDFKIGATIDSPKRLAAAEVALAAAMNTPEITVFRRPIVALIATGTELVMPGAFPTEAQIIASNSFGLAAMFEAEGAEVRLLPIAEDTEDALIAAFELTTGADLIVTIGGASVGDYDLVGKVAADSGLDRAFYKIRMRPGKPLMAGRLGGTPMIGLPGNPVSSMVCGHIFLRPMLRAMQGLPKQALTIETAPLAHDLAANGPREHFMRARLKEGKLTVFQHQDSALITVLAASNALVIRKPHEAPLSQENLVNFIKI